MNAATWKENFEGKKLYRSRVCVDDLIGATYVSISSYNFPELTMWKKIQKMSTSPNRS
jgi:hypothetical protein